MKSLRILRLVKMIFHTNGLPPAVLLQIIRSRDRYSPLYRTAALRHLVFHAPLSVTGGRPFAERRRRVRKHYAV
ncbi:hypothetical protein PQR34_32260 [Paraburkholderia sediminicola]|uniref:hypothetical protein n=1 Tax=Paraburkholderia sediminicola TaxID=458836 RepID=UPI0038B87CF0